MPIYTYIPVSRIENFFQAQIERMKEKISKTMTYTMYIGANSIIIYDIVIVCGGRQAGACDSFTLRRRTYSKKFRPAISYTNPRDEHCYDSRWVFEKKGLSLYSLWFFFLLTYRVYLRPAQPPAAGGFRSPPSPRRRTVVGQILCCSTHTHTRYLLYNTCTHATQILRLICSRVLGPVFIYTSL